MALHAKMAMFNLQLYPWKLCPTKYELDINAFVSYIVYFHLRVLCERDYAFFALRSNEENNRY